MINIGEEELIPIRDVPALLPRRPNGRKVHISAIYRWCSRGVRGCRLATIKVGGTTYTSMAALQAFAEQLSAPIGRQECIDPRRSRSRRAAQVSAEVGRILYGR